MAAKKKKKNVDKKKPKSDKKESKKLILDKTKLESLIKGTDSDDEVVIQSNRFFPATETIIAPIIQSQPSRRQLQNLDTITPDDTNNQNETTSPIEYTQLSRREYIEMAQARGESKYIAGQATTSEGAREIRAPTLTPTTARQTRQQQQFFPQQNFRVQTDVDEVELHQTEQNHHVEHYVTDIENVAAVREKEFDDKRKYKALPR